MKNFHLPLPEQTYGELRLEAERRRIPATSLARQAIQEWLRARRKAATRRAIAAYAAEVSGTEFDLDERLEAAALESLLRNESESYAGKFIEPICLRGQDRNKPGIRPVIVVSNDGFDQLSQWRSVVVVPMSTSPAQARRGPTVVAIPNGAAGLSKEGIAVCHQ